MTRAGAWRIKGWTRIDTHDLGAVKSQLAHGRPVIFGMEIGQRFQNHHGDAVMKVLDTGPGLTSHAMVLVGYDDARQAFRLQNSHGTPWGDGGYAGSITAPGRPPCKAEPRSSSISIVICRSTCRLAMSNVSADGTTITTLADGRR